MTASSNPFAGRFPVLRNAYDQWRFGQLGFLPPPHVDDLYHPAVNFIVWRYGKRGWTWRELAFCPCHLHDERLFLRNLPWRGYEPSLEEQIETLFRAESILRRLRRAR